MRKRGMRVRSFIPGFRRLMNTLLHTTMAVPVEIAMLFLRGFWFGVDDELVRCVSSWFFYACCLFSLFTTSQQPWSSGGTLERNPHIPHLFLPSSFPLLSDHVRHGPRFLSRSLPGWPDVGHSTEQFRRLLPFQGVVMKRFHLYSPAACVERLMGRRANGRHVTTTGLKSN